MDLHGVLMVQKWTFLNAHSGLCFWLLFPRLYPPSLVIVCVHCTCTGSCATATIKREREAKVKTTDDNKDRTTGTYNHIHDYMYTYMLSSFPTYHSQCVCLCICVCVIACMFPYVWGFEAKDRELAQAQQQLRQLGQQVTSSLSCTHPLQWRIQTLSTVPFVCSLIICARALCYVTCAYRLMSSADTQVIMDFKCTRL